MRVKVAGKVGAWGLRVGGVRVDCKGLGCICRLGCQELR